MEPPVNFDNLREITGADAEIEGELFRVFLDSSTECLEGLRTACGSGDETSWRKVAHAFKGICFNLGAAPLGELCKHAQDDCRATLEEKMEMISAMEKEFARVRDAITPYLKH